MGILNLVEKLNGQMIVNQYGAIRHKELKETIPNLPGYTGEAYNACLLNCLYRDIKNTTTTNANRVEFAAALKVDPNEAKAFMDASDFTERALLKMGFTSLVPLRKLLLEKLGLKELS